MSAERLNGTVTRSNLKSAFAGESKARNKYTYYASKARKEGYVQIAQIFEEAANNEKEHAKIWFKLLYDGIADTAFNLQDAAEGEHFEWTDMYAGYALVARGEGFEDIAKMFELVGAIEKEHEERFKALLDNLNNGGVFAKKESVSWQCINCGHVRAAESAPNLCPVCHHPQAYFAIKAENY